MHTSSEGTVLDFNCSLIQSRVQIRMEHQLNFSRTGKRMVATEIDPDALHRGGFETAY